MSPLLLPVRDVTSQCCVVLGAADLTSLYNCNLGQFDTSCICSGTFYCAVSLSAVPLIIMVSLGFFLLFFSLNVQEQEFLQKQQQDLDGALKKIIQQHKLEIATIERDCLNHKQQLLRGRE